MDILNLLVNIIIWGIVFAILWWGIQKVALPEPFNKVAVVVLVLLTIVVLLSLLFGAMPTVRVRV